MRSAAALLAALCGGSLLAAAAAADGGDGQGCGVAWAWTGALGPDGVVIKARLTCADAPPASVEALVWPEADGPNAPSASRFPARSVGPHKMAAFDVQGLQPRTAYKFRIASTAGHGLEAAGAFATPGPLKEPQSFSLGFASCADNHSNSVIFDVIREHKPLFFFHTGDLHYGNVEVNDTELFHEMYDQVMSNPRQRAFFSQIPLAYMWDDHDFGPNNSHQASPGRESSIAAFLEAVPHYPLAAYSIPEMQARKRSMQPAIFFSFSIGRVRFIATDTSAAKVPHKTALGAEQLAWLKMELLTAAHTHELIVWVSTMPWVTPHSKWGEFAAERDDLVDVIRRHDLAKKIVMLSGDAHMLAVDDGSHSPGGFPVFQAAALDAKPTSKGGPYSHGIFPGRGQYGWLDVVDDGSNICVKFSGRRVDPVSGEETEMIHYETCDPTQNSPRNVYTPSPKWVEKLWKKAKKKVIPHLYRGDDIMVFLDSFNMSLGMIWARYAPATVVACAVPILLCVFQRRGR